MGWFSKTNWLVADDPSGSWWCTCPAGIVDASWHNKETFPAGGTGWLWSCSKCSRAFMFAKCVSIRGTLKDLARKRTPRTQECISQSGELLENVLIAKPDDWLKLVRPIANAIRKNERYVYFDGQVFPAVHGPIKFDGLYRSHDLPDLPHLSDTLTNETLANPDYWAVS